MKLNQVRLDRIPEELVDELEAAPIVCIVTHAIQLFWLGLGLVSTSVFIFAGCCTCVRLDACGTLKVPPSQKRKTKLTSYRVQKGTFVRIY